MTAASIILKNAFIASLACLAATAPIARLLLLPLFSRLSRQNTGRRDDARGDAFLGQLHCRIHRLLHQVELDHRYGPLLDRVSNLSGRTLLRAAGAPTSRHNVESEGGKSRRIGLQSDVKTLSELSLSFVAYLPRNIVKLLHLNAFILSRVYLDIYILF